MKTIANLINFNAGLKKAAEDGKLDNNPKFKAAVENSTVTNRAGTPARKAENLTIAKMNNMNAMPFQNAAQVNAAGMMGMQPTPTDPLGGMNQVVQGGIPGTLPGSGNVPGVNQVPPTNRLRKKIKHSKVKPFTITEDQLESKSLVEDQMESGNLYNQATFEREGYGPASMDTELYDPGLNRTSKLGEKYSSDVIPPEVLERVIKKSKTDLSGTQTNPLSSDSLSMGTRLGDEPKRVETKKGPKLTGSF